MSCNQYHHNCYDVAVKSGDKVIGSAKMHRYNPLKRVRQKFHRVEKRTMERGFVLVSFVEKWLKRICVGLVVGLFLVIVWMAINQKETLIFEAQAEEVKTQIVYEIPPALKKACTCESGYTHFDKKGNVLRGRVDRDDIGICQINERINGKDAKNRGFNIYEREDNIGYAINLFERQGLQPWSASINIRTLRCNK